MSSFILYLYSKNSTKSPSKFGDLGQSSQWKLSPGRKFYFSELGFGSFAWNTCSTGGGWDTQKHLVSAQGAPPKAEEEVVASSSFAVAAWALLRPWVSALSGGVSQEHKAYSSDHKAQCLWSRTADQSVGQWTGSFGHLNSRPAQDWQIPKIQNSCNYIHIYTSISICVSISILYLFLSI